MIITGPDADKVADSIAEHIYASVVVSLTAADATSEMCPSLASGLCDLMEAFITKHKPAWTVCGDQDALIEAAIETGLVVSVDDVDERGRRI